MNINKACQQLQAISLEIRLRLFRTLIKADAKGITPGDLCKLLNVSCSNLSFHLAQLTDAGLITARREGRFLFYSANCSEIKKLISYISESCCN